MDASQVTKRGRKPSQRTDADRETGTGADRAGIEAASPQEGLVAPILTIETVTAKPAKPSIDWGVLSDLATKAQDDDRERRIVRLWHPNGPDVWRHEYCNAPVENGDPAYQFNTGEIVAI